MGLEVGVNAGPATEDLDETCKDNVVGLVLGVEDENYYDAYAGGVAEYRSVALGGTGGEMGEGGLADGG